TFSRPRLGIWRRIPTAAAAAAAPPAVWRQRWLCSACTVWTPCLQLQPERRPPRRPSAQLGELANAAPVSAAAPQRRRHRHQDWQRGGAQAQHDRPLPAHGPLAQHADRIQPAAGVRVPLEPRPERLVAGASCQPRRAGSGIRRFLRHADPSAASGDRTAPALALQLPRQVGPERGHRLWRRKLLGRERPLDHRALGRRRLRPDLERQRCCCAQTLRQRHDAALARNPHLRGRPVCHLLWPRPRGKRQVAPPPPL
ncbi:hypothetical protein H4S06_001399, partial [Coemansia sp. BCRC 34490]